MPTFSHVTPLQSNRICFISKEPVRHLVGDWTKYVYSLSPEAHKEYMLRTSSTDASNKRKSRTKSQTSSNDTDDVVETLTSLCADSDCECLWKVLPRPDISAKVSGSSVRDTQRGYAVCVVDVQHDEFRDDFKRRS